MKGYVAAIGLVDKENKIHYVRFHQGLNIITGKSSTGKSAILHIFDYCMGSSRDTIPYGQLTISGIWFFTILSINESFLTLGRNRINDNRYIKEQANEPEIDSIDNSYFEDEDLIKNKSYFNSELSQYFGLNINSITEDTTAIKYRINKSKDPRPSIRSIIPFIIQHQNVVANKDNLFYGFEKKEKKEKIIEHFKIFTGMVDAHYFAIKRQLNDFKRRKRVIEIRLEDKESIKSEYIDRISHHLQVFSSITGLELLSESLPSIEHIFEKPDKMIYQLKSMSKVDIDNIVSSDKKSKQLNDIKKKFSNLKVNRRRLTQELFKIENNIINKKREYIDGIKYSNNYFETEVPHSSECVFCKSENDKNYQTANKLNSAINWLNKELDKSNYHIDSFEAIREKIVSDIENTDKKVEEVSATLKSIELIEEDLGNEVGLDSQAYKIIGKLELILEEVSKINDLSDNDIRKVEEKIRFLNQELVKEYNIDNELIQAELYINEQANRIGSNFDFEKALTPINLNFSLKTFELVNKAKNGDIVDLSSMGSGANWLYSHLSLFLALHRYLCKLRDKSIIPPILFLDQPTQVYFPTTIRDESKEFNPNDLAARNNSAETIDDDLESVTNIFNQLVQFCEETKELTGIMPQIIVTDHVDNLDLDKVEFKDFVRARWRNRGFIHPLMEESSVIDKVNHVLEGDEKGQLSLFSNETNNK